MTISPVGTPASLLHHFRHNHVLHEQVVLLTIHAVDIPKVLPSERLKLQTLGQGFYRLEAYYGFMESPNVPKVMHQAQRLGLKTDPATATFYLGREILLTHGKSKMMRWRKVLFAFMSRNIQSQAVYFSLPPDRVIELGVEVEF